MSDLNELTLTGVVLSMQSTDWYKSEPFYQVQIEIIRKDSFRDIVPIVVSEQVIKTKGINLGDLVTMVGSMRTLNEEVCGKSKLAVYGLISDIEKIDQETLSAIGNKNQVVVEGYICKSPNYRITPKGKIITDLKVACNRDNRESDYFPCITWDMEAEVAKTLKVGDKIGFRGRFQSRVIHPVGSDKTKVHMTYEISIVKLNPKLDCEKKAMTLKAGA